MNAKVDGPYVHVTLSKRNLLALLEKVDDPTSVKQISRLVPEAGIMLHVEAEPDDVHYGGRPAGGMRDSTEEFIRANGSDYATVVP
jgi:hypothetical protein